MVIRRLIRQVLSSLVLLGIVRRYGARVSLMKIQAAQVYVRGVRKTRAFFLGGLLILVSFVFLVNGLSLIQTALFTYSMWSNEVKFAVALVIGGVELAGAIGVFFYLFSEEIWGKFSGIPKVVDRVIDKKSV